MIYAQVLHFLLFACVTQSHCAKPVAQGSTLIKKCQIEPTVEGCESILLSWSYSSESKTCEKGFVCMNCDNRFDTQNECTSTCKNAPVEKRKRNKRNCRYWLAWGANCQEKWLEIKKSKTGKVRKLLYYTGCGQDKDKLFEYDLNRRRCHLMKNGPPRNQTSNKIVLSSGVPAREGRRNTRSSGTSNAAPTTQSSAG